MLTGNRYCHQPSVTRLAQDRAASIDQYVVWDELKGYLRKERERGILRRHLAPDSSMMFLMKCQHVW